MHDTGGFPRKKPLFFENWELFFGKWELFSENWELFPDYWELSAGNCAAFCDSA